MLHIVVAYRCRVKETEVRGEVSTRKGEERQKQKEGGCVSRRTERGREPLRDAAAGKSEVTAS